MKLTIVYDNIVYKNIKGLKPDWGFSCLIQADDANILFDTGAKANILFKNMKTLGIDPAGINKIVISHEHWDHNGSLEKLADYVINVDLYRINQNNEVKNMDLVSNISSYKITDQIFSTGTLKGIVDEQSLVLKAKNGYYVLLGCSHPGVEKILKKAAEFGKIIGIIGGLHNFDDFEILKNLEFICPCHCTKYKKKLKEIYPNKYVEGGVGKTIDIL